jgi:aminopeptidase N
VPFAPEAVMMDLEEKLCDATTDYFQTVNSTGEYEFPNTFFNIDVEQITDSAFFRVTHNWAPPDSLKTPVPGLRLSDYRYWKIDGIFPEDFIATGRFCYNRNNYLDNTLILSLTDSVVILYRSSPAEDWQSINFTKVGIWMIG